MNENFFSTQQSKEYVLITIRTEKTLDNISYLITIEKEKFKTLPHEFYTEAESHLYTILKILEIIETSPFSKFIIDTDSNTLLKGIVNPYSKTALTQTIQSKVSNLKDKTVKFSHQSITSEYLNTPLINYKYSLNTPTLLFENDRPIPLERAQKIIIDAIHNHWNKT